MASLLSEWWVREQSLHASDAYKHALPSSVSCQAAALPHWGALATFTTVEPFPTYRCRHKATLNHGKHMDCMEARFSHLAKPTSASFAVPSLARSMLSDLMSKCVMRMLQYQHRALLSFPSWTIGIRPQNHAHARVGIVDHADRVYIAHARLHARSPVQIMQTLGDVQSDLLPPARSDSAA